MSHEEEAKEIMRKFKLQHEQNITNLNFSGPSPNQSPEAEIIINQMNNTPTVPITAPVGVTGDTCPQCKTMHPPLGQGESCPNATQEVTQYGMIDADINKHLVDLRNIVISQMDKKQIKDGKKFFQFAVIELMKVLEGYNE